MALIVSGISLPFERPVEEALERARRAAGGETVTGCRIVKRSVDARRKRDIRFVYSVELTLEGDEEAAALRLNRPDIAFHRQEELRVEPGTGRLPHRPVVVGFGPCGMFAGLLLARYGLRPLILERGGDVDARVAKVNRFWETGELDPACNVQFGEGGAGTFSDGKLTTRIGDKRCGFVLRELAAHGAPEEILWQARPHVGTDKLRAVVKAIREEIVALGGEIRFDTPLTGLTLQHGEVRGIRTPDSDIPVSALALAVGHSARDVFEILRDKDVAMEAKPFSVGVRIERLQRDIDRALYGEMAGHPLLPPGEYQLSHREGGRAVYTFCMCPGGVVVPAASEAGMAVTNGMSEHARDGRNANSALVVSVDAGDFGSGVLDGVAFQRRLESAAYVAGGGGFAAPAQTVDRFLAGKPGVSPGSVTPTYALGVGEADFAALLPEAVTAMLRQGLARFDRKLRGFAAGDALLTGVESRTSSPVRILRGDNLQSANVKGLYPCGEGAGCAGGIVSAAVDGLRAAEAILEEFGRLDA